MNITKRKPVSVGEMITEEFLVPMEVTQAQLAQAMGVCICIYFTDRACQQRVIT